MFKTLKSRVIATYLLVVFISILVASVVFMFFLAHNHRDTERYDLVREATAVAREVSRVNNLLGFLVQEEIPGPDRPQRLIQGILDSEAAVIKAKLFVVDQEGKVVVQARRRPLLGIREPGLPRRLMTKSVPTAGDRSFSRFGKEYLIVSAPTMIDRDTPGFLMAMKAVGEMGSVASSLVWYMVLAGAIAFAAATLVALYFSNAVSRPVRAVAAAARKMAAGDYDQKVESTGSDEISELADDFNIMAERVRTTYRLQRDFVGDVSHELRTPLTSIEGFSQALLDGVASSEEERQRSLAIINEESKRMVRVLNDLLLLSEIDAGGLHPEKRPVDVMDLMRKIASLFHGRAEQGGIDLRVDVPPVAMTMQTDPDRLERVLTNLLDNAFKYTGSGGTIVLSASKAPGSVSISVADTGLGIAAELLPQIFDRFYRVEKSRSTKHGGAGLGLSICKELVETLGGSMQVQSLEGKGTTFTVTLPL